MGVIKVPTAESRMGPGELPNFRAHSNASPEAFGSGVAKATQNLGAVVGEMAGLADKYVQLEEQDEREKRKNELKRKLSELKYGKKDENGSYTGGFMNENGDFDAEGYMRAARILENESTVGLSVQSARTMREQIEPHMYQFGESLSTQKISTQKIIQSQQYDDQVVEYTEKVPLIMKSIVNTRNYKELNQLTTNLREDLLRTGGSKFKDSKILEKEVKRIIARGIKNSLTQMGNSDDQLILIGIIREGNLDSYLDENDKNFINNYEESIFTNHRNADFDEKFNNKEIGRDKEKFMKATGISEEQYSDFDKYRVGRDSLGERKKKDREQTSSAVIEINKK